jgi:hypothetical protein
MKADQQLMRVHGILQCVLFGLIAFCLHLIHALCHEYRDNRHGLASLITHSITGAKIFF